MSENEARQRISWLIMHKNVLIILILIAFFSVIQINYTVKFKQLPSCLYGCDLYSHLGTMYHLAQGGSIFENGQLSWTRPWTPELYHMLVVGFSKILSIDVLFGTLWFSILLFVIASGLLSYLAYKIFNEHLVSIFVVLLVALGFPVYKYSPFAFNFIFPLFAFVFYWFVSKRDLKILVITGLLYGLTGYSNTVSFVGATILVGTAFLYQAYLNRKDKKALFSVIRDYALVVIIGLPIALLYWWWPFFNHYHSLNNITYYGYKDFDRLGVIVGDAASSFFNLINVGKFFILPIISVAGLLSLFVIKTKNDKISSLKAYACIVLVSALIGIFHAFVTYPLLKISAFPYMMTYVFFMPLTALLFYFAFLFFKGIVKNRYAVSSIAAVVLILVFFAAYINYSNFLKDKFTQNALSDFSPQTKSLQSWLREKTDINDVFLTTKEVCFMLNGIAGRKCMVYRTTHADPFSDVWTNQVDAAVILYGNDSKEKLELLKKYNVKYLYWEYFWMNSEWSTDDQGNIVGKFDPLLVPYDVSYENQLKENNISYAVDYFWFDPAYQGEDVPKLKGIVISPDNYYNFTHPWKPDIDKYLEEVWSYDYQGQKMAVLYKIKAD